MTAVAGGCIDIADSRRNVIDEDRGIFNIVCWLVELLVPVGVIRHGGRKLVCLKLVSVKRMLIRETDLFL